MNKIAPTIIIEPNQFGAIGDTLRYASAERRKRFAHEFGFAWQPETDPRKVADQLIFALMNEENWAKGTWCDTTTERCTDRACYMGHIRIALWGNANEQTPLYTIYNQQQVRYLTRLYTELHKISNKIASSLVGVTYDPVDDTDYDVINFNDHNDTIWEDVYVVARSLKRVLNSYNNETGNFVWEDVIDACNTYADDISVYDDDPSESCNCSECKPPAMAEDEPPF